MASNLKTGGIGASRSTEKDFDSSSRLGRRTKMEDGGHVESLLKFLSGKEEPFSYWDAKLDDDGRIMNFFFRDSRCASDYELFDDELLADTAYKMNKYNLMCVPFMGINQHHEKVMFGLALLSDETSVSFDWLLGTFLKSMFGKQPGVVISDRCHALMDAIDRIFWSTSHRINLNASSHFGSLNRNDEFKKMWHHCVDLCETEAEFETSWRTMFEAHDLGGRAWFIDMYDLRKRWSSVFTSDRFSTGIRATTRSKALRDLCSRNISLRELVQQYLRLQADFRRREAEKDVLLTIGHPGPIFPNIAMLVQASLAYLRKAYKTFEGELRYTFNVHAVMIFGRDASQVYTEYECRSEPRARQVRLNRRSQRATCTCRMWETEGILCRHILKVYNWENVYRLPEEYIMRRWTRDAKKNPEAMALVKERMKRLSEEMKAMRRSGANFEKYQSAIDGEKDCACSFPTDCSAAVSTVFVWDCPCPASRNAHCQRLCLILFEHRSANTNERESEHMEKLEGKELWDYVTYCFNLNRPGIVPREDLMKMVSEIQPYHKDGGCVCVGRVFAPARREWEAPPVFPIPYIQERRVWNEMDAMTSQPTGTDAFISQLVSHIQG